MELLMGIIVITLVLEINRATAHHENINELHVKGKPFYGNINADYVKTQAWNANKNSANITGLFLPANKILGVDPNVFESFPSIVNVDLSSNLLLTATFKAPNVQNLNLCNNELTYIHFPWLPALEWVNLAGNRFRKVDWNLRDLPLSEIDLSNNPNLTAVTIKSQHLQVLALQQCSLEELELDAPRLEKLDLRQTKLRAVGENTAMFDSICRMNTKQGFSILYLNEEETVSEYECGETTVMERLRAVSNCKLTTLRIKYIDDVVLSSNDYHLIVIYFNILLGLIVVLMFFNIFIVHLYTRSIRRKSTF